MKGNIKSWNNGSPGWLWPGTQAVGNNGFPDPTTNPRAFFRIQQPTLISGLSASLGKGPGLTNSVNLTIGYTPSSTGIYQTNIFTISLTGTTVLPVSSNFYNGSVRLTTGDKLHLEIDYTGGNSNTAEDLSVQIDLF